MYDEDICIAIRQISGQFQNKVVKELSMLLRHLATGFSNQKRDMFGFGEKGTT